MEGHKQAKVAYKNNTKSTDPTAMCSRYTIQRIYDTIRGIHTQPQLYFLDKSNVFHAFFYWKMFSSCRWSWKNVNGSHILCVFRINTINFRYRLDKL